MWDRVSKIASLLVFGSYLTVAAVGLRPDAAHTASGRIMIAWTYSLPFLALPLLLIWFGDRWRSTWSLLFIGLSKGIDTKDIPGWLPKLIGWVFLVGLPLAVWYVARESERLGSVTAPF